MLKRGLLFLTVLLLLFSFSSITNEVSASSSFDKWALDATAYKEFRVVELDPSAKIEVTYYDKNKKKEETKSFPITEKGFVVPDLSEHIKNPGFNLITKVIIEKK
ncbi:TPA: hypothetical protein O5J25_001797 [Staphylococcus aureus]|nr:hypothetical protein [Staphylococcus aureus]